MEVVRSGYSGLAAQYVELFGRVDAVHPDDLDLIDRHLASSSELVLDAGCGPGHLAGHLARSNPDVVGVDLVAEFVRHASAHHDDAVFGIASLTHLPFPAGALSGVLAWYSLIHLTPSELDDALAELRRVAALDAPLVVGFFDGADGVVFDHRVAPARSWSLDGMSGRLQRAGFDEIRRAVRPADPHAGVRAHAAIVAVAD